VKESSPKIERRLATLSLSALAFLAILFVLGIYTSLYVEFPEGANGWKVMGGSLVATLHMSLGSLFGLAALGLLVMAIVSRRAAWIACSAAGLLFSIVAIYGGTSFVPAQNDTYSFVMALGFVGAFFSYAVALYVGRRKDASG
jgi:hypothetical protein